MARVRTTKELAQRIQLEYFQRPHPIRSWMKYLSVGALIIAAGWLVVEAIPSDQEIYSPGPVSQAHALFGNQCTQCHGPVDGKIYWRDVTDAACLKCHDGPIHHENQLRLIGYDQGREVASHCASCHDEHKGQTKVAWMSDRHCTQCHANLQTKGPAPHPPLCLVPGHQVERRIHSFTADHPEFAVLRTKQKDAAQIKLNHEVHLKPNLRGLTGPVQMTCTDCHQWDDKGAYMTPIRYEKHCLTCHLLDYDPRLKVALGNVSEVKQAVDQGRFVEYVAQHPDQFPVVPHVKPEEVRAFLQWKYAKEKASGMEVEERKKLLAESAFLFTSPEARLLNQLKYAELPRAVRERTDQLVRAAEDRLYRTKKIGCLECHVVVVSSQQTAVSTKDSDTSPPPSIARTAIPNRWLPHSTFDHKAHRMLECIACHTQTPKSRETTDVLVPGIKACTECHRESGGARSNCVECHLYHDKSRERNRGGQFTIQQLLAGAVLPTGPVGRGNTSRWVIVPPGSDKVVNRQQGDQNFFFFGKHLANNIIWTLKADFR